MWIIVVVFLTFTGFGLVGVFGVTALVLSFTIAVILDIIRAILKGIETKNKENSDYSSPR